MYEWRFPTSTERFSRQNSANGGFTNTPMILSMWEAWFGQDDKTWDGSDPREVRQEVHNSGDDPRDEVGAAMEQLSKSWRPVITQARILRFIGPDTKQVGIFHCFPNIWKRAWGYYALFIQPRRHMFHPSISMLRNCGVRTDLKSQAQPTLLAGCVSCNSPYFPFSARFSHYAFSGVIWTLNITTII